MPAVHLFRSVGSTNDVARRLAEEGAASGTAVLADEQLAGRGRLGRSWASPPGLGIWLSLIVRPRALPTPGVLPLNVALAVAHSLDRFLANKPAMIKWPNDLLFAGRKLGGILCEAVWEGARPAFVVIGVGINVRHTADDFPADLRVLATSLHRETGELPEMPDVAASVVRAVTEGAGEAAERLDAGNLSQFATRDALRDREVQVSGTTGATFHGVASGIAADGSLLVRSSSGRLRSVRSGTVRPATAVAHV